MEKRWDMVNDLNEHFQSGTLSEWKSSWLETVGERHLLQQLSTKLSSFTRFATVECCWSVINPSLNLHTRTMDPWNEKDSFLNSDASPWNWIMTLKCQKDSRAVFCCFLLMRRHKMSIDMQSSALMICLLAWHQTSHETIIARNCFPLQKRGGTCALLRTVSK